MDLDVRIQEKFQNCRYRFVIRSSLLIKSCPGLLSGRGLLLSQGYVALRHERGNGMLVHHLLTSVAVDHDRKVVECLDRAPNLKTVGQVDRGRDILFAQLVQERVLNINGFVHNRYPQLSFYCHFLSKFGAEPSRNYTMNLLVICRKVFRFGNVHPLDVVHMTEPRELPFSEMPSIPLQ